MTASFKLGTRAEAVLIHEIARRAVSCTENYSLLDADMDITACHANGCALDLIALLNASDGDFGHDVFGIRQHIDRRTGKLGGLFHPRHALPEGIQ